MEDRTGCSCSIFRLVAFYSTLKMETADSSEILAPLYQIVRHHIHKDYYPDGHHLEILKPGIVPISALK
jgi:hypothetical protein